jgi:2-dehydro-3-deoxygalactonokinase
MTSSAESTTCAIYVDMGTTNTRVWLMQGTRVVAFTREPVGVRSAARSGSNSKIREVLREMVASITSDRRKQGELCTPACIVAGGMITSSLGLAELRHIRPPAGLEELQAAAQWHSFPDVSNLPVLLIPGVRCGPESASVTSIHELDVMRGEETLCAGLVASVNIGRIDVVMSLGSHWKAIQLDEKGRIAASVSSLSGELIDAAQQNTILAGSIAQEWPADLSEQWIQAGLSEQRRSGIARTAFCTRLLDLEDQGTLEERLAFLVGAFIAADLDALVSQNALQQHSKIALVGSPAITGAWHYALSTAKLASIVISQKQAEDAFLTALRLILEYRLLSSANVHSRRTYSS